MAKKQEPSIGRPTVYDPKRFPKIVWYLCQRGATNEEIASCLAVSPTTVKTWQHKYPEFMEAMRNGKKFADANVAASLYESCFDHEVIEVKQVHKVKKDGEEVVYEEKASRVVPANTLAQQIWLYNRDPDNWRRNPGPRVDIDNDPLDSYLSGITDEKPEEAQTEEQEEGREYAGD